MTKLLEEVLRKVGELPEKRQDDAAQILLEMLESDATGYRLTDEQLHEVEQARIEADKGKFATEKEIQDVLGRPWA